MKKVMTSEVSNYVLLIFLLVFSIIASMSFVPIFVSRWEMNFLKKILFTSITIKKVFISQNPLSDYIASYITIHIGYKFLILIQGIFASIGILYFYELLKLIYRNSELAINTSSILILCSPWLFFITQYNPYIWEITFFIPFLYFLFYYIEKKEKRALITFIILFIFLLLQNIYFILLIPAIIIIFYLRTFSIKKGLDWLSILLKISVVLSIFIQTILLKKESLIKKDFIEFFKDSYIYPYIIITSPFFILALLAPNFIKKYYLPRKKAKKKINLEEKEAPILLKKVFYFSIVLLVSLLAGYKNLFLPIVVFLIFIGPLVDKFRYPLRAVIPVLLIEIPFLYVFSHIDRFGNFYFKIVIFNLLCVLIAYIIIHKYLFSSQELKKRDFMLTVCAGIVFFLFLMGINFGIFYYFRMLSGTKSILDRDYKFLEKKMKTYKTFYVDNIVKKIILSLEVPKTKNLPQVKGIDALPQRISYEDLICLYINTPMPTFKEENLDMYNTSYFRYIWKKTSKNNAQKKK